jgi:hypothetical protein
MITRKPHIDSRTYCLTPLLSTFSLSCASCYLHHQWPENEFNFDVSPFLVERMLFKSSVLIVQGLRRYIFFLFFFFVYFLTLCSLIIIFETITVAHVLIFADPFIED